MRPQISNEADYLQAHITALTVEPRRDKQPFPVLKLKLLTATLLKKWKLSLR